MSWLQVLVGHGGGGSGAEEPAVSDFGLSLSGMVGIGLEMRRSGTGAARVAGCI